MAVRLANFPRMSVNAWLNINISIHQLLWVAVERIILCHCHGNMKLGTICHVKCFGPWAALWCSGWRCRLTARRSRGFSVWNLHLCEFSAGTLISSCTVSPKTLYVSSTIDGWPASRPMTAGMDRIKHFSQNFTFPVDVWCVHTAQCHTFCIFLISLKEKLLL